MTDIILECATAATVLLLIILLVAEARTHDLPTNGWNYIMGGLSLVLFGCVIDILDNFESLSPFVVIGDTIPQAILEKLIGTSLGFALMCIGIIRWIPKLSSVDRVTIAHDKLVLAESVLMSTYEELEHKQKELLSIVHNTPDIIFRLDKDGKITFINKAIEKYGYSVEKLIGQDMLNLVHPDDRNLVKYNVKEKRTGDRSTHNLELRLMTAEDAEIIAEINAVCVPENPSFILDAEGLYTSDEATSISFLETQGVARDITQRKELAEHVSELQSIIPICSSCKNVQDDEGFWQKVEVYFNNHNNSTFSHSICPVCSERLYPEFTEKQNDATRK